MAIAAAADDQVERQRTFGWTHGVCNVPVILFRLFRLSAMPSKRANKQYAQHTQQTGHSSSHLIYQSYLHNNITFIHNCIVYFSNVFFSEIVKNCAQSMSSSWWWWPNAKINMKTQWKRIVRSTNMGNIRFARLFLYPMFGSVAMSYRIIYIRWISYIGQWDEQIYCLEWE